MKILLVEDDRLMAETLVAVLQSRYIVEVAQTAKEAEIKIQLYDYSCILIDYSLPDSDGIQLCKTLREEGIATPVLMLTGEGAVQTKVLALCTGADDYLVKPVDSAELHARIQALLRRSANQFHQNTLTIDTLMLDPSKRTVTRGNKKLTLKRKEFDLLEYLMLNAGRVLTRAMIFDHIWESNFESDTNVVDVHIKYLRDQVDQGFEKKLIKTVHGSGYKIEA